MPTECCAVGCNYKLYSMKNKKLVKKQEIRSMYRIPKDKGKRRLWLAAINRSNINPDWSRICSSHFITGKPSNDPSNPDYAPSVFNHQNDPQRSGEQNIARYNRKRRRIEKEEAKIIQEDEETETASSDEVTDSADDLEISFSVQSERSRTKPKVLKNQCVQVQQPQITCLKRKLAKTKMELCKVTESANNLKIRNIVLEKMTQKILSVENLKHDNILLKYYTGIVDNAVFQFIIKYVSPLIKREAHAKLKTDDCVLMCLVKLRLGLENRDLAYRFGIHPSTVSRIFSRIITVLANVFKHFIVCPNKKQVRRNLPIAFQKMRKFRNTRFIIDCTEIFIERPKPLIARAQTYSNYKSHNTLKFLGACSPTGGICYLSHAWGGRVSDLQIIRESGFYDVVLPNDVILADRGFPVSDYLGALGARLLLPAFTRGKAQLTGKEVEESRQIAQVRIHIERCIRRFKTFGILQGIMPITLLPLADKITIVIAGICNLMPTLVKK